MNIAVSNYKSSLQVFDMCRRMAKTLNTETLTDTLNS